MNTKQHIATFLNGMVAANVVTVMGVIVTYILYNHGLTLLACTVFTITVGIRTRNLVIQKRKTKCFANRIGPIRKPVSIQSLKG